MKRTLLFYAGMLVFCLVNSHYSYGQGVPEILYYKFNGTGTSVPNLASNPPSGTSTATLNGNISQGSTGTCGGKALVGSGTASSTDYVNTGWTTNTTGSWTISLWTKDIGSSSTLFYIFGDASASSFRCFTNGVAGANNWMLRGGGFPDVAVSGGATTSPHVTTFVRDSAAGAIYAYLDGVLVNTVSTTAAGAVGSGPFKVCGYASNVGLPANGLIDEFRFYNRALTATQVARLRYAGSSSITVSRNKCDSTGYTSPSGKYTWTTSGTYRDTIPTYYYCDSVITVNLTVGTPSANTIAITACNKYTSPSGKFNWTASGTYIDVIPNSTGCDSTLTINLTINNSSSHTLTETVCDAYLSPAGKTYTSSGTYIDTLTNSKNCDSLITINLTVNYTSFATISPVACDSFSSPSGKYNWTTSGTYMDTLVNTTGCDSAITVNLTLNYSSSGQANIVACDSFVSPSGNHTWKSSGNYSDILNNATGCDSTISINLTVLNSSSSLYSHTACDAYTGPSGTTTWTVSGTYTDVIPNNAGCDSLITVDLTVNYSSSFSIMLNSCNSYTSPSGNYIWTATGMYNDTIVNNAGCDSFMTIDLTILDSTSSSITVSSCVNYITPGGSVLTASGIFHDTIANTQGCDSVITINLTIVPVDVSVSELKPSLMANAVGAAYQWLDCNTNLPVSGATSQQFTPTANGSYAVEVTANSCTDTSVCYAITNVGLKDLSSTGNIKIYPNPSEGAATLHSDNGFDNAIVRIWSMTGEIILESGHLNGNDLRIDLSGKSKGIYLIEVMENGTVTRLKMIKY